MHWQLHLPDETATAALGAALAYAIKDNATVSLTIALDGDLGAGKTTLSRGLLRALGHSGPVPSPTYTLLEPYAFDTLTVHHLDLYRLADGSELEAIGWRDLDNSIRLIEWPSKAPEILSQMDLLINLTWDGDGRMVSAAAQSAAGRTILRHISASKA